MSDIRVLHVDDDPDYADLVATFLERTTPRLTVVTETNAGDAMERLSEDGGTIDCLVSDYDMPGANGLELLEDVRATNPDLPFILFTGKGSEEVASDAIAAGATDYLRKKSGSERYELLANRIENAVEQYRSRQERERVYQALETATQGIGLIDEDGEFVYLNEAYAGLYGRTTDELVGSHWDVLYPDEEVERFETEIIPALREEGTWTGRSEGLRADGTRFTEGLSLSTLDSGGHVCVVQDLTERIEQERELRRKERQYRGVFEDPNILVGVLGPEGTLREANRTAMEYLDVDPRELVGKPFWETPWWNSATATQEQLQQWIDRAANGEYVEYEAEHGLGDGRVMIVEGVIRPVIDDDGDVESLIVSARDVTERRRRERRLERQNERFDDLAGVVSHDLQTPLSTARGRLELALETGDEEHVEAAIAAIDRVDELRSNVIDVLRTREITQQTERVAVADALADATASVESLSKGAVDVEDDPIVEADPDALVRLFENLLSNSVEHGEDPTVRVGTTPQGIFYEDDGPGIDPEIRQDVFSPGFSTKDGPGGGMGLTSVRQIVDAHDWDVAVRNGTELDGVRFEFFQ